MTPILALQIRYEQDVVLARQRAKQISTLLGCDTAQQTRLATAVSELARNAFQYAEGGRVEFALETDPASRICVTVSDRGPGISSLREVLDGRYTSRTGMGVGLVGARRLMDAFRIESTPQGTTVYVEQSLPGTVLPSIASITAELAGVESKSPFEELQRQNQETLELLDQLTRQQREVQQLNGELEETNRGVVALYAELDERADSLRAASELKSRFLSYMSHEFRTPLNSILSLSGLLLRRLDGDLSSEQEKQVTLIRTCAGTLLELVNDLLDLARVEAGKLDVVAAEFTLGSLLGTLRGMMRPLHIQADVELIFEEPDPSVVLHTDEAKLSQIVRNFLSNAMKFTDSGEVRVWGSLRDDDRVAISVRDTGIGIAPGDVERVFQDFVQIPSAAQKRHKGSGLGLPLSRKLAELLGGTVEVSSHVGRGSTFMVIVPRVLPKPSDGRPQPIRGSRRISEPTILIVDDDDTARYLVRQHLAGVGGRILEARNGEEGLQLVLAERPDLIILDLVMPRMTGFELIDELHRRPETRTIPVIVCTSHVLSEGERAALAPMTVAVLSKESLGLSPAKSPLRALVSELGLRI